MRTENSCNDMANNKKGNLWILISVCLGCIIMSTVVYVAMLAFTHDYFVAIICAVCVATFACVCVWQVFTQLENLVPKKERERIKAEQLAEEERKRQLAERPEPEPVPQPIQIEVHNHNTMLNQQEIVNEVKTEVVTNVVNDITNNNVNVAEASATAQAPTEVNVEAPNITVEVPRQETIIVPKSEPVDFDTLIDKSNTKQADIDCSVNSEDYKTRNSEFIQAQVNKHNNMLKAVVEYVQKTMSSHMRPTEIEKLCKEILAWANYKDYKPNAVVVDGDLSTYDVSHFIWNIAERLGTEKRYTGENKGNFIKLLFPKICSQIEASTLASNLRAKASDGKIHIDEMEKNPKTNTVNIAFHYPTKQE